MNKVLLLVLVTFITLSTSVSGQVNTHAAWTWVKGSDRVSLFPQYGTTGSPAPGNLPGGRQDNVSWQDASGAVWIFGGVGNTLSDNDYLNDIWKYEPGTNEWTFIRGDKTINSVATYGTKGVSAPGNQPGSRVSAASWTDAAGNFYLFGGYGYASTAIRGRLNDLWKYDPVTNEWTWINGNNTIDPTAVYGALGIPAAANSPGGRSYATVWYDGAGTAWLFGGRGYANAGLGYLSDLWKYNNTTNEWTWSKGPNVVNQAGSLGAQGIPGTSSPFPSERGVSWVDATGKLWMTSSKTIGGQTYMLMVFDPVTSQWTCMKGLTEAGGYGTIGVPAADNMPRSRYSGVGWVDASNQLWLFGGNLTQPPAEPGYLDDLWKYDPIANQWTRMGGDFVENKTSIYGQQGIPAPLNKPGGRSTLTTWKDASGDFFMMGGGAIFPALELDGGLNEIWRYQPSTNNWSWMKGDTSLVIPNQFGIQGTGDPGNTPGGRQGSMGWSSGNNLWLMGGHDRRLNGGLTAMANDLWKFDLSTLQWTFVKGDATLNVTGTFGTKGVSSPLNQAPSRRSGVSLTDATGKLWLFGGFGQFGNIYYWNDLWRFDPSTTEWTWISGDNTANQAAVYGLQTVPAAANKPGSRSESAGWTDASGNLYIFGGTRQTIGARYNDLWKYDPVTGFWTWLKGASSTNQNGTYGTINTPGAANTPGARHGAFSWTDDAGLFWLYGGTGLAAAGGSGNLSDLWRYDPATNEWTWISGPNTTGQSASYGTIGIAGVGNTPGARTGGVAWTDNTGDLWLYAGLSAAGSNNDLWKYERTPNQWIWVKGDNTVNQLGVYQTLNVASEINKPGSRNYPTGMKDAAGNFWLFGGQGYAESGTGRLNDLWKISSESLLPLHFLSFNGNLIGDDTHLKWKTENENNTKSFVIERSNSGSNFRSVGTVNANNAAGIQQYAFTDRQAANSGSSVLYYRLKQIDIDGRFTYSGILKLNLDQRKIITVSPNPVTSTASLSITLDRPETIMVKLFDLTGKMVQQTSISLSIGTSVQPLNLTGLPNGVYQLQVQGSSSSKNIKIIKQ